MQKVAHLVMRKLSHSGPLDFHRQRPLTEMADSSQDNSENIISIFMSYFKLQHAPLALADGTGFRFVCAGTSFYGIGEDGIGEFLINLFLISFLSNSHTVRRRQTLFFELDSSRNLNSDSTTTGRGLQAFENREPGPER